MLLLGSFALAGALRAETYVWAGSESGAWDVAGNWYIQTPWKQSTKVPGAGDTIAIAINKSIRLDASKATDVAVFAAVDKICLAEVDSRFAIDLKGTDLTHAKPIYGGLGSSVAKTKGRLRVMGPGTLRLTSPGMSDYALYDFAIDGATVYMPQAGDLALSQYNMGTVAVSNNATLYLPTCHDGTKNSGGNYLLLSRLFGDGTVTAVENTELRFDGVGGDFSGVLTDKIRLFTAGGQNLTGISSTMNWTSPCVMGAYRNWSTGGGVLGVMKFGKKGEASSIGKQGDFQANVHGGTYRYLGAGEETDKYFSLYPAADGLDSLDGGATGGLVFVGVGGFRAAGAGTKTQHAIVGLNGSNETACVFGGICQEAADYLISIVKKGTGKWRFADPDKGDGTLYERSFRGTVSVDEGVLQFDTIAPPGEYCSIGLASMLKPATLGAWANLPTVDWAFSLGGTNAALKALAEGTLEYTGTKAGLADRRKIILEADGRLRANGARRIRYRMVAPTSPRAKTLTLDGSSLATNEVHDVTDTASHPVSVVKEGSGTWLIGGEQSFHGDLTVKGGKLIARAFPSGSNYTWFRYTIKSQFDPVKSGASRNYTTLRFLGLYDADGNCQTLDTQAAEGWMAAAVEPGQAGYETTRRHSQGIYTPSNPANNDNPTNLFVTATCYDACLQTVTGASGGYPKLADESSYLPFVFRLKNGAPAVASYDCAITYGWQSGSNAGFQWMPNRWSLEGSVDGIHWENVNPSGEDYVITTNDCPAVEKDNMLVHANVSIWSGVTKRTDGWLIRGTSLAGTAVLPNVSSVQVDKGAALELEGGTATVSELTVDVAKGGGTISGLVFADEGTVNLVNYPASRPKEVDFDLGGSDASSLGLWQVRVNGVLKQGWSVRYANGKLQIVHPGILILFK